MTQLKSKLAAQPVWGVVIQSVRGPSKISPSNNTQTVVTHSKYLSCYSRCKHTPTRTMQDQILQTLLDKGDHGDHNGHDGFFDGPGNPMQSNPFSLCPLFGVPKFLTRGIVSPLYVTSQIAIAVPLGLAAFLTFCVLRTKWSHFYMALARQRGTPFLGDIFSLR